MLISVIELESILGLRSHLFEVPIRFFIQPLTTIDEITTDRSGDLQTVEP